MKSRRPMRHPACGGAAVDMDTAFLSLALAASALILAVVCAAAMAPDPEADERD